MKKVYLALIHYPVKGKQGEIITSSITNMDLHDIARSCRTFDVKKYYIVSPLPQQQKVAQKIIDHWHLPQNEQYHPDRSEAFKRIVLKNSLREVIREIESKEKIRPKILATCAKNHGQELSWNQAIEFIDKEPVLLLFGTSWGLSEEVIKESDGQLPPIQGCGDYNHLSVRSAVAIYLYKLLERI